MTEFSIYQINVDRDTANVCFIGMESLEKIKGTKDVNAAAYDRVYDGKMDCISLENIYQKFNVDHPADYKGRSLSVSDVVEIRGSDTLNPGFYFVDSIGFKSISFDKSLCKEPVEAGGGKISALLVEPNKYPKMIEIDDTLEAMQEVVGGDIEEYMPFEDEVAIICNEEGKVNGLTPNRAVYGEPQAVEMTFAEMRSRFCEAENEGKEHLSGYIVFSQDSFDKPYDERSRTYGVSSNNKAFQKEILLAYAQQNNFPNPQFFTDDGFSGTTFDRPSFIQMENLVEQGVVDTIIVKDLSRFGRNYLDVGNYLEIKYPTLGVRFIAIQENVDTLKETGTEMMPFNNIFNEWYAAQTSKKIRAVWKNKAANGKRVSPSVPFGYVRNPQNKEDWLVDEPAAEVVRKIYALCLDGRGPSQIARQLEQEKVLIPTAYYASLGRKTRKQYTDPYAWDQKTVAGILVNQQYTGCTVNFMTTTISYKVHKTVYKPKDEWQIIPNTQPAIIDEDTWKRVQELREHRIRPTATGRTSLFSGKAFCADCGSKLHFCAAKSLNANQEYYRCSNYKSGRGSCQIHFIRNVVLEKIVLEAINSLADFVRCYEPVFLYLMVQKDIVSKRTETSKLKTAIESGKRRIQDLDKLIERIYEDQVLGNISAERYARMSVNYENEQRTLINKVAEDEKKLACIEQTSLDLKTLLKVLRSSTSFDELTPTLVNSLIRRIEVHNNDKSSGHCYVKVDIYFTAIGLIDIPTEDEIKSLMAKIKANPQECRLTA